MILRLAFRTLAAHPVRTAVLATGFGLGVAVMAILLGVGQIVLQQARSRELVGGGDVLVTGSTGTVTAARVLLIGPLRTPALRERMRVASPWSRATLYLSTPASGDTSRPHLDGPVAVRARGGVPSLEQALGDPEVAGQPGWTDTPADAAWASPDPGDVLRAIDRFHPIPDVPSRAHSWAEWLYFNGRSGHVRFYLTFLVGPDTARGRVAGVRLQLDRGQGVESYGSSAVLEAAAVARAPNLTIGSSSVQLDGLKYRLRLDLADARGRRAVGQITITAPPGRLLPPIEIHGARGWRSGYVVPVMSGALTGSLMVDGEPVDFQDGASYHDHNWGFWEGVSWQWGQVQHGDTSFVYGRVFPPADAADPARLPGFLGALGPEGPLGYATNVRITETNDAGGRPRTIRIAGRSAAIDLTMRFDVESVVINRMVGGPPRGGLDFLQLRGSYAVSGHVAGTEVRFDAPGSAETFRGR